jgi:pimeloyl-ACP methyl ester carboxylesterase
MSLPTRHLALGVVLAAPLLFASCDRSRSITAPPPVADEVAAEASVSLWSSVVDGEDGGALYRLMMPTSWNGDLVVLAHGYVDPLLPVTLPVADFGAFADSVGKRGFAVAFSSYSETGSAVKDGAQRTHALTDVFTGQFTAPRRVLLAGQSMGGLIALNLGERFPTQYAGIFSFCGVTGGSTIHHRYIMDVRALFDVFYRKPDPSDPTKTIPVLPGDALHVDREGLDLEAGVRQVARNAMLANDAGARVITQISRTPVPFAAGNRNQMINSIADALFRHAREIDDIMARGHDASAIDNTRVQYTGPGISRATLDFINDNVQRFESSKYAEHMAEQYYDPEGSLQMPFVSLRTTRDPALPAPLNDDTYLAKLTQSQRDQFVEVRVVNAFGHCSTTIADVVNAFDALVTRVNAR